MHQRRSSGKTTASWIKPLLMSMLETSDGSERTFFIAGSIGSITGLKDLCRFLKVIFSGLHGGHSVMSDNAGCCCLWLFVDGFNVNVSIFLNKRYKFRRPNGAWYKCCRQEIIDLFFRNACFYKIHLMIWDTVSQTIKPCNIFSRTSFTFGTKP